MAGVTPYLGSLQQRTCGAKGAASPTPAGGGEVAFFDLERSSWATAFPR